VLQQDNKMYEILMIVYLVVALGLVGFILIQQGKGAGMGSSFGSGASGTVFGAGGSGNFLTKTTAVLAIIFFGVALALGNLTSDKSDVVSNSLFPGDDTVQTPATDIPGGSANSSNVDTELPASNDEIPVTTTDSDIPVVSTEVTSDAVKEAAEAAEKSEAEQKESTPKN
jgi:preprotein translocase subunit SecG